MASECGPRTMWILVALLLVTAITTAVYLLGGNQTAAAPDEAQVTSPSAARPASTPTVRVGAPHGLQAAVQEFLTAWSTVDPTERAAGLASTATRQLAGQLSVTDPEEVPPACALAGALTEADITPESVLVTVPTSCEGPLWLGLTRDPTATHGWRVTAIGRERSWIQ